ncbi:hypothetical protein MPTK1_8g00250 [Marchantia polymorpha subsp. ruderalis]|uniref:Thioredoxin domain-containing protein n=2 Tax=Marchantia polymorpha TaxID=3197 RepID=A0A176VFB1_MARPO|nr:hypothetical protein AXG93_163s1180 [Marchantia polymorpha subsp. ruderalis]PTQ34716.1 hypothetical protein MARPO_0077s0044 [Marchantia polymorpha]BBN18166.1 hypothetical protein Mp_8g00250 [Marchantia polymorpha subsp. ruderalis]|eukprot:PTQ34716.1 hypothetical protein MARPO_0077s0044 [Marchantia polymorpha]
MGRSIFTAVALLFLLKSLVQFELGQADKHETLVEDTLPETEMEGFAWKTKTRQENREWDDEFEGTPSLRVLTDDNFEHDTQAATGQTTGLWLVLFWTQPSVPCRDAEATLLQVFTKLKDGHLLVAGVNISANPRTVKRFSVHEVPLLLFFRDRHMYKYKGHWAAMNIINFVKEGYKSVSKEEVPKEITYYDELLETPLLYYHGIIVYLANRPGILAGVGSTLAMCGYLYTRKWLLKKKLETNDHANPRKRVD